ncbi:hypothetical protein BT69DRAFT_331615 [Atractiella rhizophila]|nr:hypothetical protein BT69DRAFT_331615 [Atractiella rhizophila]
MTSPLPSSPSHTRTPSTSSLSAYPLSSYPPLKSSTAIEFSLSQDSLSSLESDDEADATAPLLEGLISSSSSRNQKTGGGGHSRVSSLGGGDISRGFTIVRGREGQIDAVNTNLIVLDKGGGLAAGIGMWE